MNTFEVNAAIEALIGSHGTDEAARRTVWAYAKTVKPGSQVQIQFNPFARHSQQDSFSGHTAEHGTVQVWTATREDEDTRPPLSVRIGADHINRVGYYRVRLIRFAPPKDCRLTITHFWKATQETESDTEQAEEWILDGDLDAADASFFGKVGTRVINFVIGHVTKREAVCEWADRDDARQVIRVGRHIHLGC